MYLISGEKRSGQETKRKQQKQLTTQKLNPAYQGLFRPPKTHTTHTRTQEKKAYTVQNNCYVHGFYVGSPAADQKTNGERPGETP
jgi:hypothetical protein